MSYITFWGTKDPISGKIRQLASAIFVSDCLLFNKYVHTMYMKLKKNNNNGAIFSTFQWESGMSREKTRQKGQPIILRFARRREDDEGGMKCQEMRTIISFWFWSLIAACCCYCNSETGTMMISKVKQSRNDSDDFKFYSKLNTTY